MNFLVSVIFVISEFLIPLLPYKFNIFIAKRAAKLFYYLIPVRKSTARNNLKYIFPSKSEKEISDIIKSAYENVFIVIVEFFYLSSWNTEKFKDKLRFINLHLITEKLKLNKGLIVLSAHFANWELTAFGGGINSGVPFSVIVKEQSNKFVDRRIIRIRESGGNRMIEMKRSVKEVLKVLHNNGIVAMLGDQFPPLESKIKVKFFGREITVFEGPALFALKTGSPVLVGIPIRQTDGNYLIKIEEIDIDKYGEYNESNAKAIMQEYFLLLEHSIKQQPGSWLWFHRRFKSQINY